MSLRLDIGNRVTRKAICISLVLFMGVGFSVGVAKADSCRGGADCLICARQPHRHLPAEQTGRVKPGCTAAGQNSTCGFEAAQGAEKFYGIASTVRSFQPDRSAIFSAASVEDGQFPFTRGLISPLSMSDPKGKAPIYLLNHSLLC